MLELSCGVSSLQQAPWWNADRRARDVSREPHPLMRKFGLMRLPAFRFLLFVARVERSETRERHPSQTIVSDFAPFAPGYSSLGMIEPKAGPTAGLGVTRSCSAGRF